MMRKLLLYRLMSTAASELFTSTANAFPLFHTLMMSRRRSLLTSSLVPLATARP